MAKHNIQVDKQNSDVPQNSDYVVSVAQCSSADRFFFFLQIYGRIMSFVIRSDPTVIGCPSFQQESKLPTCFIFFQ